MRATGSAEPLRILHIVHQYLPEHVGGTVCCQYTEDALVWQ